MSATVTCATGPGDAKRLVIDVTNCPDDELKWPRWQGCGQHAKSRNLRERGPRFIFAAHFLENVREQDVLARLIGLATDRPPLRSQCLVEIVLP